MVGDILLSGADVRLESGHDLWDLLQGHRPESELILTLVRAGAVKEVRLTPSARPTR
jgi:S1-C subfamily serine protease